MLYPIGDLGEKWWRAQRLILTWLRAQSSLQDGLRGPASDAPCCVPDLHVVAVCDVHLKGVW